LIFSAISITSIEFFLFCAVVTAVYFLLPPRVRVYGLLIASYIFYAVWNVLYVPLLLASTLFNYWCARRISTADRHKDRWLILAILVNVGVLIAFKYTGEVSRAVANWAFATGFAYVPRDLSSFAPLGISFFTFMQIAYVIDVRRKRVPPESNLAVYATFVAFFAHIISGPISRAGELLPQLKAPQSFDPVRAVEGFRRVLWGVFKKVMIADRIASFVNPIYGAPTTQNGLALLLATLLYAFQIYADFSAYSDIVIGVAQVLGIRLPENFRQPYFAASVREFWQRWHISLSNWIRDYLFYPLTRFGIRISGNRSPLVVQFVVSVLVMAVVGLWHDARWTFLVWGMLHGVYLAGESAWRTLRVPMKSHMGRGAAILITFILVAVAWVFFRAQNLPDALYILGSLFRLNQYSFGTALGTFRPAGFVILLALVALMLLVDYIEARIGTNTLLNRLPAGARWAIYYGLTFAMLVFGFWGTPYFIYFGF